MRLPDVGKKVVASRLLGGGNVEAKQTEAGIEVAVPSSARQQLHTVVELKLDGPMVDISARR